MRLKEFLKGALVKKLMPALGFRVALQKSKNGV